MAVPFLTPAALSLAHPRCVVAARVQDASEITAQLNALWRRYAEARDARTPSPNGQVSDAPWPMVTARAATLNLIAATRAKADADRVRQTIAALSDIYPSRATVLIADPAQDTGAAPGMDVRVDLLEQEATRSRPAIVLNASPSMSAPKRTAAGLDRLAAAGARSPRFSLVGGRHLPGGSLFSELVDISDRLVVDSAISQHAAGAMQTLLAFAAPRATMLP